MTTKPAAHTAPTVASPKPAQSGGKTVGHTPGPWIVKRDSGLRQRIQTAGDKGTLCYMTARPFAHGANFSHGQIAANAYLIAAAPDLFRELEFLVKVYGLHDSPASRAIAKARGAA